MLKNISKEIIIILLLTLAIILILGVILYEYVPTNKIIPEKISYSTPETVKSELETDTSIDDTQVVVTYEIDATDLNNYKKIQEYVPGKKNPFESIVEDETTENNNTTTSETQTQADTNTNSNTDSNTNKNSNEDTGYIPDKGTK